MALLGDFTSGQQLPYARMRNLLEHGGIQAGVLAATDLKVTQRAAGADMSVDVAAGAAWVKVSSGTRNGLCHVQSDAPVNVAPVPASHGSLPRVDQVVLQYNDTAIPAGVGGNIPTLRIVPGVATAGATLDNRNGAAALPNDCLRLADVLVPALASAVTAANIRDRRPWAHGAFRAIHRDGGANYTTTATVHGLIDAALLQPRLECTGKPLRMTLALNVSSSLANGGVSTAPFIDGAAQAGWAIGMQWFAYIATASGQMSWTAVIQPAAGSHLIGPAWRVSGGTGTIYNIAGYPVLLTIDEILQPNADNT